MRPNSYAKPAHLYTHRGGVLRSIGHLIANILRLILPVLIFLVILVGADFASDTPITWLDASFMWVAEPMRPSHWLTAGHLIFPLAFFALNLINRRYGVGFATATIVVSWGALIGFAIWLAYQQNVALAEMAEISVRTMISFVAAAFIAQFISISIYEVTRGFPWWRAPFYASLAGALAFCLLFFPAAFLGNPAPWGNYMMIYALILLAASFVGLFPYFALKKMLTPMKGLGYAPD